MTNIALLTQWASPCGELAVASADDRLLMVDWVHGWHHATITRRLERLAGVRFEAGTSPVIGRAIDELEEWFAGRRREFDLNLAFYGTDFQKRVWEALTRIPYGETVTYGDIASSVGSPRATRAVGVAVGENPFSIIVPCHRVVGKNQSLTGYGGGYDAKRFLLAHEWGCGVNEIGCADGGCRK